MKENFLEKRYKALEKPPIQEGEVFNPEEEVKEIRQAPKDQQRRKLAEYKEKLAYQKEGLGRMQEVLITKIKENPDINAFELYKLVEAYGEKYGFTDKQKEITDEILQKYIEKHNAVKEIREKYPNDDDLFRALFGKNPEGEIKIEKGPITLFVECYDINDYVYLRMGKWNDENKNLSETDIESSKMSGGTKLDTPTLENKVDGCIVVENMADQINVFNGKEDSHEEQHVIYDFFFNETAKGYSNEILDEIIKRKSDNELNVLLSRYFKNIREFRDLYAKGELLAFFRANDYSPNKIYEYIINSELYRHSAALNWEQEFVDGAIKELGEKYADIVKSIAKEEFEEGYKKLIEECIDSFVILIKNNFSVERIVAILEQEPIRKWKKAVGRIIEERKFRKD